MFHVSKNFPLSGRFVYGIRRVGVSFRRQLYGGRILEDYFPGNILRRCARVGIFTGAHFHNNARH